MSDHTVTGIRTALLAFYDASARSLPWRGGRDPYRILVSEVMAQQTRIDTVIPYYERWMQRFPDVHVLADATEDDVLRQWAGLGYYSRARNLHAAARLIRDRHGGSVPGTCDALRTLPGIGDYTAGAVSSIAFGEAVPAVDGNVRRVLSRLLDQPDPPQSLLRRCAAVLVPDDRPGDFNQALMEFGSRVCVPRAPQCESCPLRGHCAAFAAGTQHERPLPKPKKVTPCFDLATAVLRAPDGRVLLQRRNSTGLLAGMWSFPSAGLDGRRPPSDEAPERIREVGTRLVPPGTRAVFGDPEHLGIVSHAFSHRRERYHCHLLPVSAALPIPGCVWIDHDAGAVALPRAQQKIHALAFERSH